MNHACKLHAQLIKSGLHCDPLLLRPILTSCVNNVLFALPYLVSIFDSLPAPDTFAWNTIIRANINDDSFTEAMKLFVKMRQRGSSPDHYTFPFVLKACANLTLPEAGRQVHGVAMKLGVGNDIFVQNGLISMYANCGLVVDALDVFEGMRDRDLVSWSTLITCFTNNGLFEEALGAFKEMQMRTEIEPDMVTMVSIISAISSLGALELGKWVHCFVEKSGFGITASLGTALITMYSKCGFMEGSVKVFEKMSKRNLLTWTALIKGLAEHGQSRDAVAAFYKMKESGLQPDYITFIGVLSACSHGGLLEEGWDLFNSIKRDFGFEPGIEHYGCMVDLLGRKGLINEAFEFMEGMAIKPTSILWRTLLGACVTHGNIKMAVQVARKVQELDPYHDGDYVLLSNAYGVTGAWTEKAGVRNLMNVKGIRKEPGCSLIEVDQVIHEFVAGDDTHPRSLEIKEMLKYVLDRLKAAGYDPDISNVLFDIDEEEKEESLNFHSEKLAVAFALIMFKVDHRKTIRIVKNLRICRDCHSFMKLVSREFAREIIIRDRNRFHHFRDESCSCNDYW